MIGPTTTQASSFEGSSKRYKSFSPSSAPIMESNTIISPINNNNASSKSKRKDTLDQSIEFNTEVITNQIKKCRIYCTPGELRLQKDMIEVQHLDHINIEDTESASSIIITFKYPTIVTYDMATNDQTSDYEIPRVFMVTISRFYPHTCPDIRCLQPQIVTSKYILPGGTIQHSALGDNWSALGSLWTVVDILTFIRSEYASGGGGGEFLFDSSSQISSNQSQEVLYEHGHEHEHNFPSSVDAMSLLISPSRRSIAPNNRNSRLHEHTYTGKGSPSQVSDARMFSAAPSSSRSLFTRDRREMFSPHDMTSTALTCSDDVHMYTKGGLSHTTIQSTISTSTSASMSYDNIIVDSDRYDDMDLQTADEK